MSTTKVTDSVRDTTAIDGTKINAVDAAKITTGTIPEARITTLDATKLTGNIANARIPASAVTQHVTATDLTAVHQGIATLGLHMGVADNKTAFNLPNSFIDTFEDDTGLTTQTSVDRIISGEYVASVYSALSTPAYITGDRTSRITVTQSGWSLSQGTIDNMVDGTISEVAATAILGTATSDNTGDYFNFDFGSAVNVSEFKWYRNATSTIGAWQFSGSANADHSSSVNLGSTFTLGGVASGAHPGTPQIVTAMSANTDTYRYYRITGTGGTSTGGNWDSEIEFKEATATTAASATGTLISDTQTAPSAITETSGAILYTDNAGTNVLGTDLKIYITANNGTNWTEAASYGTPQTFSGTTKQVKLGKTTVTSGTQVALKAVWANQLASSSGSSVLISGGTGTIIGSNTSAGLWDGSNTTGQTSGTGTNDWGGKDWGSGNTKTVTGIRVWNNENTYGFNAGGANVEVKLQGSTNGSSWVDLGTTGSVPDGAGLAYPFKIEKLSGMTTSTAYRYHRILFNNTTDIRWSELEFYETSAAVVGKIAHLNGWAVNY